MQHEVAVSWFYFFTLDRIATTSGAAPISTPTTTAQDRSYQRYSV